MNTVSNSVDEIDAYALSSTQPSRARGNFVIATGFGLYAVLAVAASYLELFDNLPPWVFAGAVAGSMFSIVLAYVISPSIRLAAMHLGPMGLARFHIWRIPAALTFLYYGWQGWLPDIFVTLAGWGDMLAGVLAAALILLPYSKRSLFTFHVIGFADFLVAVGTGLTLQLLEVDLMQNITALPVALIPLVGVPLSGASHIIAFDLLRKQGAAAL